MEVIVGVLVTLIVCSIGLHLLKIGYELYKLNWTTRVVAEKLGVARELALGQNQSYTVLFDSVKGRYGLDHNCNGRLDSIEAEDLPTGITLSEDTSITFSRTGRLVKGSEEPKIIISNTRKSRTVSVSSLGAIDIE